MADEKETNVNNEENVELEAKKKSKKGKKTEDALPKSKEELYVESLSKAERKEYEKKKKALRRSQWVDEYWIIILLAVALLVVICALVISNTIRGIEYTNIPIKNMLSLKSVTVEMPFSRILSKFFPMKHILNL